MSTRPLPTTAGAVLMLLMGSVTASAGTVFSAAAGGAWLVATALFPIALVLWWVAGIGVLKRSLRAHRLALGLLAAMFGFGLLKIFVYHESAAYLFQSLTIVITAALLSTATRRWLSAQPAGRNEA